MTETHDILINDLKTQIYKLYTDINSSLTQSEKEELNKNNSTEITSMTDMSILIDYLKVYIQFLIQNKQSTMNNSNKIFYNQLESYIIKLESEIKYLMKMHFQNKIQKDSLEMKIRAYMQIEEEYEELKEKVKYEDGKFLDNDRKDHEIIILRRENSNLKKEITKLEEENKEITKLKNKNKELEQKKNEDEETIKGLKYKVTQLSNKVEEIEEELNIAKNNLTMHNEINAKTSNENNSNLMQINDNNSRNKMDYYNISGKKVSLDKFTLSNKNHILKPGMTSYKLPSHLYSYESNKNNNRTIKTIDTNKYVISTYNKIYNNGHKNIITPIKNDIFIKTKKIKNNSVSMREENEKSELISKYLSGSNTSNKYIKHIKSKSLNRIGNNMPGYKLPMANNSIKKYLQKDSINPYEHSALNILGINKKI